MKAARYILPFLMGSLLYALVEITARGYTHWTMVLTGGAVLTLLSVLFETAPPMPMPLLLLCGGLVITAAELSVGVLVNLRLGWDVWDYTDQPLNLRGQICPLFSLFWCLICIPARILCGRMKRHFGY